ncbi:MAG TPA: 50S ribosomal protein L9 [Acidimicrobiales bacterium]|jgi:large subunit ribosomal protein L9
MRIVLRDDVADVGKKGDILVVADGFARNYLIPKGKAFVASDGVVGQAQSMRRSRDVKDAKDREAAETVARTLVPAVITVRAKAGAEGKLFGSVTVPDLVGAISEQTGVDLDRRRVHLEEPIKSLGTHQVLVKLHADVEFPVTVEVVRT